jgi:methyl-accepting chemotaxis protein
MVRILLFLIGCILVWFVAFGSFAQNLFSSHNSRAISELFSLLPRNVNTFLHTINGSVAFFGVIAVLGIIMAATAFVNAAKLSRKQAELEALNQTLGLWKERAKALTKRLPKSRPSFPARRLRLSWKIAGILAGMMFFIGLLLITVVYQSVVRIIQNQAEQRAKAIAITLSDGAAMHISAKKPAALRALLIKYTALEKVAYAFVEDEKGRVLANTLDSRELQHESVVDGERSPRWTMVTVKGRLTYDTQAPILDGRLGTVHIGIWKDAIDNQIQDVAYPFIRLILIVFMMGVGIVVLLVIHIVRPIVQLTETAREISRGDLDRAAGFNSCDEIGDLARSLERMRSSLKAAMIRLNASPSTGE